MGFLPAYSGEYEEATRTSEKIFLYMYTKNCSYCVKFNPVYKKISEKYSDKMNTLISELSMIIKINTKMYTIKQRHITMTVWKKKRNYLQGMMNL